MDLKEMLKKQIIANVIKDKCKHCAHIYFNEADCTQDRIIRFETDFTKAQGANCGYEVHNGINVLEIRQASKTWLLTDGGDANKLFDTFDYFLETTLPQYESEQNSPDKLTEGEKETITLTKYERNPKARAECLAYHGTSCAVCGMDFGNTYGPEFADKIEVHHIVPLSQIGREYVVDPIHDLVPVCPNCHATLHSKPGGVYTVEELIQLRRRR